MKGEQLGLRDTRMKIQVLLALRAQGDDSLHDGDDRDGDSVLVGDYDGCAAFQAEPEAVQKASRGHP